MHVFFNENNKNQMMFTEFFSSYLDKFDSKIMSISNGKNIKFNGVYKYIYTCLIRYSVRAFIRELHNYKNNNLLDGKTSKERYESFEKIAGSSEFKRDFFQKYPVLKSYFECKINQIVLYVYEIVSNFEKDKNELEKIFKVKFEEILDIYLGEGDTHNDGKSVAIVKFNCGKIVYKPHDLSPDIIFDNIVTWFNSKDILKCKLNSLKVLSCNNHGWQEFIHYDECKNYNEVQNYYYRAGCFLAIFYALGTSDIHYENVIVNKEFPYFIDLETLFSINNSDQIDTVLSTSFIPNRMLNGLMDLDLSGLCGNNQVSSKLTTISIVNPKTDEMKVDTKPAKIYSNNNLVKLNCEIVKVEEYVSCVIDGFQEAIELILNNKNSLLNCIEMQVNTFQKFRQVIRFTHVYAKFLIAASHPDYLQDENKHIELFQRLYNGCNNELDHMRITNEINTLLKWDVPFYNCYYNSKDLFSDNTLICKDFFNSTIRETLHKRIERIDDKIIRFQIDVIKKSLFIAYDDQFMKNKFNKVNLCSKSKVLNKDITMEIAESIASNILEPENSKEVAFLIHTIQNNKLKLSPINFHLYEGGGMIWLFACLGKIYNNDYYKSISTKLLETAVSTDEYYKIKKVNSPERISAFSGIGSLMYLYYNLYRLYKDENYYSKYVSTAKKIIEFSSLSVKDDSINYDLLCGISGLLIVAIKIYLSENDNFMKEIIDKYSDCLLTYINNNDINKVGLAHGLSGYSLALIMLYRMKNDNKYLDLANILINKENMIYSNNTNANNIKTSWCNGETGMLLVRNELFKINQNSKTLDDIFKYLQIVITNGFYNISSMCLCHGIYGNIEVVNKVIKDVDNTHKIINFDKVKSFEKRLINNLDDIQLGLKANFRIDTFMIGSSGIAYAKLRYLYPELPSFLCLDIFD